MPISLYRKYRPQKFQEIIAQDHITKTLISALKNDRISHAYLFSGPKGTGKTTIARLLAKSLNCQNIKGYEPCNRCQSCKDIIEGKNLDLIEIDAASNRGIDEVRELRDKIRYAPNFSKYKVFIIDEVHMLTKEAFNALLKTLEEPPSHAIFILATTEFHKIPATIISRCQRFDFKRAKNEDILKLLLRITHSEKLNIDQESLKLIVQYSDGAFRDAISLLDQIASLHKEKGKQITLDEIRSVLGIAKEQSAVKLISLLLIDQPLKVIELIEELYFQGVDLINFNQLIISILRKMLLSKMGAKNNLYQLKDLEQQSQNILPEKLLLILNLFLDSQNQIKSSNIQQLPLEIAVIKAIEIIHPKYIVEENLNHKPINNLANLKTPIHINKEILETKNQIINKEQENIKNINPLTWEKILKEIKPHNHSLYALLKDAKPQIANNQKIILEVKFKFHKERILQPKNYVIIEQVLSQFFKKNFVIECILVEKNQINQQEQEIMLSAKDIFGFEE